MSGFRIHGRLQNGAIDISGH